jgi:hypothetical protein
MKTKKIMSLVLAMLMLASLLCACAETQGDNTPGATTTTPTSEADNKALYQVTVIDVYGKPATSGVAVRFLQNGESVAMQTMNAAGVAEQELEKGDYTVELRFTDDVAYYYDTTDLTLSKTKTQLTIRLYLEQSEESQSVYVNDPETGDSIEYTAYALYAGSTRVTLKPGRNYFLYTPTESGEYLMDTENGLYKVGYYGGMHFIMSLDGGKPASNNGTALSISPNMVSGENEFVIGVDNPGEEDVQAVVRVIRVSDYIDTSVPVVAYKTTAPLTPWKMPAGATVNKFDITSSESYKLVLDETTGFYHLNSVDGPLVVVFLGDKAKDHMTYLAPYETVLENAGVKAYFKNAEGTYDRCESYEDCLIDYIGVKKMNPDNSVAGYAGGCIDHDTGLYPLTQDLMYIIQQHGNYSGWWDSSDERYIFEGINVNKENAWLFMCGYLTEK